nr:MAG TPA: PcfM DpnD/PcfM-like protein [Caudoviricetes sp.]
MLYLCTVSTKQNYTAYIEADSEDEAKAIAEESWESGELTPDDNEYVDEVEIISEE